MVTNYWVQVYYEPLKRPGVTLVEPYLVKDIFYQIPELCSLHELFLHQLSGRVQHWDAEGKIGDIFVNTVSMGMEQPDKMVLCI